MAVSYEAPNLLSLGLKLALSSEAWETLLMVEVALGNSEVNFPYGRVEMSETLVHYFAPSVFVAMEVKTHQAAGNFLWDCENLDKNDYLVDL